MLNDLLRKERNDDRMIFVMMANLKLEGLDIKEALKAEVKKSF